MENNLEELLQYCRMLEKKVQLSKKLEEKMAQLIDMQKKQLLIYSMQEEIKFKTEIIRSRNKSSLQKGFVYIAKQTNEKDKYKIGYTANLKKRLASFSTGNPYIKIIASVSLYSFRELELHLHLKYEKNNYKNEWFTFDKESLHQIVNDYGFNYIISSNDA